MDEDAFKFIPIHFISNLHLIYKYIRFIAICQVLNYCKFSPSVMNITSISKVGEIPTLMSILVGSELSTVTTGVVNATMILLL